MARSAIPRVAIVGAGASGVLLASALVRPGPQFDVVLVDPRPGRGTAWGGLDEHHLAATPVGALSLDAACPSGFRDWLNVYRFRPEGWSNADFAPRRLFGDYLDHRLRTLAGRTPGLGSTRVIQARALAADRDGDGWSLRLTGGERVEADVLVLATGLARPRPLLFHGRDAVEAHVQDDPWDDSALRGVPDGDVLLVGTGLTAADVAAALWRRRPDTRIVAVSGHGLLPRVHAEAGAAAPAFAPPYPTTAREAFAKLSAAGFVEGEAAVRPGVFTGIEAAGEALWAALPDEERAFFLRHFRPYWNAERHRLPPELARTLDAALADDRLEIVRGRVAEAKPLKDGAGARVALRAADGPRALAVGRIVNCTGPEGDPFRSRNPLLLDLLARGVAAADPLGLGLHVGEDLGVLGAQGETAGRLYALGPPTQGRFLEAATLPAIRSQAERLAAVIGGRTSVRAAAPIAAAEPVRPRPRLVAERT